MNRNDIQNPHFVSSEGILIEESHMIWIEEIECRYSEFTVKRKCLVNLTLAKNREASPFY